MKSISYIFENARAAGKITQDMIDFFNKRTNFHISLMQKYLQKIIDLKDPRLDLGILEKEKLHDQSKFKSPEVEPYIFITWSYHMKDNGKEYKLPQDMQAKMQAASFHHCKSNQHHPEFWDKNSKIDLINRADRDTPPDKIVDATNMPLTYVASMIADWCSMSEEKKNDPYEWMKKNNGTRWQFNKDQIKLIYDLLDKIWSKKT